MLPGMRFLSDAEIEADLVSQMKAVPLDSPDMKTGFAKGRKKDLWRSVNRAPSMFAPWVCSTQTPRHYSAF